MAVVTVASLDGFITVGAGGQMNAMPRSRRLSMSRSSWMIRWCSLAGDDVVGKLDNVVHGIPLLDSWHLRPVSQHWSGHLCWPLS
jgi:hypothetical protein